MAAWAWGRRATHPHNRNANLSSATLGTKKQPSLSRGPPKHMFVLVLKHTYSLVPNGRRGSNITHYRNFPFISCITCKSSSSHAGFKSGFFWPFEKKLKAKKTQNSRKKLKLKLKTQIFGIFRKKIVLSLKTCFIHLKRLFCPGLVSISITHVYILSQSR